MPEALTPFKTRIPKPVKSSTDTSKSTSSASRSTTTANPTSTSTPNSTSTSNFQYDRYNYNQCNQYNRYRQTPPRPPLNSKNRNIYCQLGDLEPPPSPFTQITTAINNRLKTPPPRPTNKSTEQLSYTFFSLARTPRGQAPLTLAPAKPKPSVSNCASNTSNTSNTLPSPSEQRRVVSVRGVEYDIAPVFYLGGRKGSFESNSSRSTTRQLPPKPPIVTKVASQPIYPWELRPTTATHFNSQTPPPIYQSMPAIYDTLQSNRPMSVAPSSFAAPTPTPQRNFQTPLPIMPLSEPVQTPPPPPPPPTPTPFHAQCRAAQCETPPPPQQIAVPVPVPVPVGVPVPVSVPVGVPVPVPVPVHCCSDQSNNNECRPRLGKVKIRKQKRRKNRMVDAFMGPPLVIPGYMAFIENLERCQQANNNCLAQTCF